MKSKKKAKTMDRRAFLNTMGVSAGIAATLPSVAVLSEATAAYASDIGPQGGNARAESSERIRSEVAERESNVRIPNHDDNGDEALYPSKIGNYSKNLKHDPTTGEVDPAAYQAMIGAISTGRFADFEALATNGHFGAGNNPSVQRRLVNPGSGYAFDLEGTDSHQLKLAPAPSFASAQEAGEMAELYWMALLRDVNFADYDTSALAQQAAADLSKLSDFRGPKAGGQVTTQTLFRDTYPGCTVGPYISQFLLQPCNFGSMRIDSRMVTVAPNQDYMTDFKSWLNVQNGVNTPAIPTGGMAFCRSGRDLTHYVNIDQLFEAYFVACINLLSSGYLANPGNPYGRVYDGGAGRPRNAAVDPNGSLAQVGFGTFGGPAVLTLACEPATRALKDVWYQKWLVHRRLRPEEFGGRVEVKRLGLRNYPIHSDLLNASSVLNLVQSAHGTALLPMAFPEGSPNHTSYGSGHATVAGACVTMLKALFDDTQLIKNPVIPNPADRGATLIPYVAPAGEPPLTVGGELNKVVSNVSQGRNMAGVHWRSDATASNALGEAATISMLFDMKHTFSEPFSGFTFTKFNGTTVTV
jgi:hypothetical protein